MACFQSILGPFFPNPARIYLLTCERAGKDKGCGRITSKSVAISICGLTFCNSYRRKIFSSGYVLESDILATIFS